MFSDNPNQAFYVDNACHSQVFGVTGGTDDINGFFQSKTLTAGVRCCTMNGNTCATPRNCENDEPVTFDEAADFCAASYQDYRLCTKDELLSDICCGTGGMCNNHAVWTSTSDTTSGNAYIGGSILNIQW